jgi:hypothetical protein
MSKAKQALFDQAYAAIISQGAPSMTVVGSNEGACVYYSANTGFKCVVGHLLNKKEFDFATQPAFIGMGITNLLKRAKEADVPFRKKLYSNAQFLSDLQLCHDTAAQKTWNKDEFIGTFRLGMIRLAKAYNLRVPE